MVRSMLQHMHELFYPFPNKVIYCYSEYQDIFTEMQNEIANIVFVEEFPSNLYDLLDKDNSLVIPSPGTKRRPRAEGPRASVLILTDVFSP